MSGRAVPGISSMLCPVFKESERTRGSTPGVTTRSERRKVSAVSVSVSLCVCVGGGGGGGGLCGGGGGGVCVCVCPCV